MGLKKLLVDIPGLIESGISTNDIECEYLYHRKNSGAFSLLEVAEFATYCRKCKESFCIDACPKQALEHLESGLIKRWNMRCVGCKSCVLACPFGTIFPEVINYLSSKCDYCLDKLQNDQDYEPACVKSSPGNSLSMVMMENEDKENEIFFFGEHLAVKNSSWLFKEGRL